MSVEWEMTEGGQYHFLGLFTDPGKMAHDWGLGTIGGGKLETWRLESGAPDPEGFLSRFKFPRERFDPGNCFLVMQKDVHYPGDVSILFVDKDSGYTQVEVNFKEEPGKAGEDDSAAKTYRPKLLTRFSYQETTFHHPILKETIQTTFVVIRRWNLDKIFRRSCREELIIIATVFNPEWDPTSMEPRRLGAFLIESEFVWKPGEDSRSAKERAGYIEFRRTYWFTNGELNYSLDMKTGRMILGSARINVGPYEHGGLRLTRKEDIELVLDKPQEIDF